MLLRMFRMAKRFSAWCEMHMFAKYALAPGARCGIAACIAGAAFFIHLSCWHADADLTHVVTGRHEEAYQCKGTTYD